ncbi:MAG: PqqD family protein [Myxococcota bacterium]
MLRQFLVQNVDTAARVIDGQAVVITPHDAVLHTLNEVGTFIWARADGKRTVQEILQDVVAEFEVPLEAATEDAVSFVDTCVRKGILELSSSPRPVDLSIIHAGGAMP